MMDELNTALNNTKLGKSSGPDGILPEILVFGGDYLKSSLLLLFNRFWDTEVIPGDLIDANITVLFKKGDRSLCNNYRGISLLSIVGKVFADIILQRLHILAERVYAESQSGYRKGRSTIDGIFTLRQMMEKSREHQKDLHIAFIDFKKAFDCVNRELLFVILEKIGCPVKMTKFIKALYSNVKAKVIVDGELSEAFNYDDGVKQGCKLAPTLYGIYAAILLHLSFNNINSNHSVKVRFRYDGNLFDLRRLKARSKVKYMYIQEAQYADDIALFSNRAEDLQDLLSAYNHVSKEMGLQINTSKTETMSIGTQAVFQVNNVKLPRVDRFKYLGSYVSRDCMMNEEIHARIQSASCAFGRLRKRVFDSRELTLKTKVKVYDQCIIPFLLYGSETWPLYQKHVKQLRTIQQRHLRSILSIKWDHFVSNEEVLERANVLDMEIKLLKIRLRWMGHICRMNVYQTSESTAIWRVGRF